MSNLSIQELAELAPLITEHFGQPICTFFNHKYRPNVWNVLAENLVIDYIRTESGNFFHLCVWLEADFEYTGTWVLVKYPADGDIGKFVYKCKAIKNAIVHGNPLFKDYE